MRKNLLGLNITHLEKVKYANTLTTTTIKQFLKDVQECKFQSLIDTLTSLPKAKQQKFKEMNFPAIRIAGVFNGLKNTDFSEEHTGLVIVDIDHIGDEEDVQVFKSKIVEDEYTLFAFISPRRDGLKVGIQISTIQTDSSWKMFKNSIIKYYKNKFNIDIDGGRLCLNANCFYSCDADLFFNKNANVFGSDVASDVKSLRGKMAKKSDVKKVQVAPESAHTPVKKSKKVLASTGFDLTETFKRIDAMRNGFFHDECWAIGIFVKGRLKSGHIRLHNRDKISNYVGECLQKNAVAKNGETFFELSERIKEHFMTFERALEDDDEWINENICSYGPKGDIVINDEGWKSIIKSAPYYTYGKNSDLNIYKKRGHFLQVAAVDKIGNLLEEVIAPERLNAENIELLKRKSRYHFHSEVFTSKVKSADWLDRMPRLPNVYWFDNILIHLKKDGYGPVTKYSDVFGDDNPELAETFEYQHYDILGIRDREHITGDYLLKNKGRFTFDGFEDSDEIILPELNQFIEDFIREEDEDGNYFINKDRLEDTIFLMGKYITTSRTADKDRMLWINAGNPMSSGRTGKTLMARVITHLHQYSQRDGRGLGEKADLKFAFANFNPAIHSTIFLDEWLSDISPIYALTTGECASIERKFENLKKLSKSMTPNLIATSNTLPKDFRKDSNKGRIDFMVASNYIKKTNFGKDEKSYKESNRLMTWDDNDPKWNILANDLLRIGMKYLKNPNRKLKYKPLESIEIIIKELGVPASFCKFVKEIDDFILGKREAKAARGEYDPKNARKYLHQFKGIEIDNLYVKFCRKHGIDALSPEYVSENLIRNIVKISKFVMFNPPKTTKINTFGVLKTENKINI